jgi:hypothetical protein
LLGIQKQKQQLQAAFYEHKATFINSLLQFGVPFLNNYKSNYYLKIKIEKSFGLAVFSRFSFIVQHHHLEFLD